MLFYKDQGHRGGWVLCDYHYLRREYLQQFLTDIRNEMIYKKSSHFVNEKLIKTENTRITIS